MSDIAIRVENLGKRYNIGEIVTHDTLRDVVSDFFLKPFRKKIGNNNDTIWAIKDISFEIRKGEVVGIIGRNGAGKSTILKILSRITEPTEGIAQIRGRVGSLLEVGTGFHPELTGRENIFLNGAILGMTKREIKDKFDEIVAFAEIEKFIDTPVKRYSSGMYLRLAFAVAAHLEPEILLVDEVLAVGDVTFQKKCLGKMGDVAKEGRTVLFVSHNMPSIQALCKRAILLQTGYIVMDGDSKSVTSHYLSQGLNILLAEVNLIDSIRRSHSQEPALRRAWISNQRGVKTNSIMMGEEVLICFQFKCRRSLVNPGFGFIVEDEEGRPIFSLNNYEVPSEKNSYKVLSSGYVYFRIPSLPLMPGKYFVSLCLVEDQRIWIDFVERALCINVHPVDLFGSGKIPHPSLGTVFVPGEITVIPGGEMHQTSPSKNKINS